MIGTHLSYYKIIEKIGQGGMGEVFLAQDRHKAHGQKNEKATCDRCDNAVIAGGQFIAFVQDGETRSVGRSLLAFLITTSPFLR